MKLLDPYPPIRIVTSYAHKDERWRAMLNTVFLPYRESQPAIVAWDDREILPGAMWDYEIMNAFNQANVFLFLLSPDSLASKYIKEKELHVAHDRVAKGMATIVPIIVRPCLWEYSAFKSFQALPPNGRPISMNPKGKYEQVLTEIIRGLTPLLSSWQEKLKIVGLT